jgi:5'-3' exonuclease
VPDTAPACVADCSAIWWRYWYAVAGDGREAYDRTIGRLAALASEYAGPLILAVDAGDSGRRALLPEYKAGRPPKPPEALELMRRVQAWAGTHGWWVVAVDGYEADDAIASIVVGLEERAVTSIIVSSDKDLLQLLGGSVRAWSIAREAEVTARDVVERYGVTPDRLGDWLALVGDSSDNIPGAPGIGPKRATALLAEHHDLGAVIAAAEDGRIGGAVGVGIVAQRDRILLARDLVRLRTDLPLPWDELVMRKQSTDAVDEGEMAMDNDDNANDDRSGAESERPAATSAEDRDQPRAEARALVPPQPPPPIETVWERQLEPKDRGEAWSVAKVAVASRALGYTDPETAYAAIMAGRAMGIGAIASLRGHHVIRGRLAMSAQLIAGVVLRSGLADYFEPILEMSDSARATYATRRKGSAREQVVTYSMEDAKRAGLAKGGSGWESHPRQMLLARACTLLARAVYPDLVGNVYDPEELE